MKNLNAKKEANESIGDNSFDMVDHPWKNLTDNCL